MKSPKLPKRLRNSLILAVTLVWTACQSNTIYHSYQPVPTEGWAKSDTLVYTLPDSIATGTYALEIGIRYGTAYPYRDLWLTIAHNLQDSLTYSTDTLQVFLADEKGKRTENSPSGLFQFTCPYSKPLPINEKSGRALYIKHFMADSLLVGINDVGIRITR